MKVAILVALCAVVVHADDGPYPPSYPYEAPKPFSTYRGGDVISVPLPEHHHEHYPTHEHQLPHHQPHQTFRTVIPLIPARVEYYPTLQENKPTHQTRHYPEQHQQLKAVEIIPPHNEYAIPPKTQYAVPSPTYTPSAAPIPAPAPLPAPAALPVHQDVPQPASLPIPSDTLELPKDSRINIQDDRLQYSQGFNDEKTGTSVQEQGRLITTNGGWEYVIAKKGHYSYISPEGIPVSVNYIADHNGYRAVVSP